MSQSDLPTPGEESQKTYQQILLNELNTGLVEFSRPSSGLFLSSLSGGLDVSFSVLLMAALRTLMQGTLAPAIVDLMSATMYSVGFIFVVVGRSELFTEHTSRAMFPVMSGHASWSSLARLWSLVYLGNLAGTAAFAVLLAWAGPELGIADHTSLVALARPLVTKTWLLTMVSAGLAGWLMGLLSWLVAACRDTISQIAIVVLVATSIGLARLPHAIVGSGEVLTSVFAGTGITLREFWQFLGWTTLGNGIGGAIFVAALKYSHSTRGSLRRGRRRATLKSIA